MNIDPSGLKTDDEIWDVLGHASLQNFVAGLPERLMTMCTEGGGNLRWVSNRGSLHPLYHWEDRDAVMPALLAYKNAKTSLV